MTTVTITGTYGVLTVHRESGLILCQQHYDDETGALCDGAAPEYADIVWIDPATLPVGEGAMRDIIHVSFVTDLGRYYGPLGRVTEVGRDPDGPWIINRLRPVALLPAYCLSHLGSGLGPEGMI